MSQLFNLYLAISGLQGFPIPQTVNRNVVKDIRSYCDKHRNEMQCNNYIYNTTTSAWIRQAQDIFNKFTVYLMGHVRAEGILQDDYFLLKLIGFLRIMLESNLIGLFVTAFLLGTYII